MEKQVADLKADVLRENEVTPQLDADTKRFHKQFTTNRNNIDRSAGRLTHSYSILNSQVLTFIFETMTSLVNRKDVMTSCSLLHDML